MDLNLTPDMLIHSIAQAVCTETGMHTTALTLFTDTGQPLHPGFTVGEYSIQPDATLIYDIPY
jgi:hypothetical protein